MVGLLKGMKRAELFWLWVAAPEQAPLHWKLVTGLVEPGTLDCVEHCVVGMYLTMTSWTVVLQRRT